MDVIKLDYDVVVVGAGGQDLEQLWVVLQMV